MIDLSVVMLMTIQLLLFLTSFYSLIRKSFDIGSVFVLLFIVFYIFPGWDLYFGGYLFSDIIVSYSVGIVDSNLRMYLLAITTIIIVCFYFGYLITIYLFDKESETNFYQTLSLKKYRLVKIVILFIWFLIFLYSFSRYDKNIFLFFSPSRKEGVFSSTYVLSLYTLLPVSFFIVVCLKDYFKYKMVKLKSLILILFPFFTYLTTGQRREIINFVILVSVLLIHMKSEGKKRKSKVRASSYKRAKIFQVGAASILLIPILWWARVVFSQLQRGVVQIIAPWERRGFLELLFGSSSGGFKTLLLGIEHKEIFDIPWGYSVYFFINSFIPRELMPNKPLVLNRLWQIDFNLTGNPSLFFVNEMYINFGLSSFLFALLFGAILGFIYYKLYSSSNIIMNIYSFVIFSNVITLFKNGFVQFFISSVMSIVIIGLPLNFVVRKKIKKLAVI